MLKRVWILAMAMSFLQAEDVSLCGDPDAKVALTNSLTLELSGETSFFSGSVFVLTVPDLRSVDAYAVTGTVRVPYRFEAGGQIVDTNGGVWGSPQVVSDDQKGITALAFTLEDGVLTPGTQITLGDITVWQYVSDGPGSVIVTVDFWGTLNKSKMAQAARFTMTSTRFVSCSEGTNSAPIPVSKSLALIDGTSEFALQAIDPESSSTQLQFALVEEPQYGVLEMDGDAYLYRAGPSFPGFDELVFSVSDGVSLRQGRICFFNESDQDQVAFPSDVGLVWSGSNPQDYVPSVLSYAGEPSYVEFVLDGETAELPLVITDLSDGPHLLVAQLRASSDDRLLSTDLMYLIRSRESSEILLEDVGTGAGLLSPGHYADLDLRPFDDHDEFALDLTGQTQPNRVTISGLSPSTITTSLWGERNGLWSVEEEADQEWTKSFLPGQRFLLQIDDAFSSSTDYSLSLFPDFSHYAIPVLSGTQRVALVNPHRGSVIVEISRTDGAQPEIVRLRPGQAVLVDQIAGASWPDAFFLRSSRWLGVVLVQDRPGELSASGFPLGASGSGLLPHLAAQTDYWENRFVLASDGADQLEWEYANMLGDRLTLAAAGIATFHFPSMPSMPNQSWARYRAEQGACVDGYAWFGRRQGGLDGSMLTGVRLDFVGSNQLSRSRYLPHVASDKSLFWTGYSILNPHPTRSATLVFHGISATGEELARESITLAPGTQEVGVVGVDCFVAEDQVAWIRIDSGLPIHGIEMFGGHGVDSFLAGFSMPGNPVAEIVFPLVWADDQKWSGIALINVSGTDEPLEVTFVNVDGTIFDSKEILLTSKSKITFLVPAGFFGTIRCVTESARPSLLGFALIGDHDRRALAGYVGM